MKEEEKKKKKKRSVGEKTSPRMSLPGKKRKNTNPVRREAHETHLG